MNGGLYILPSAWQHLSQRDFYGGREDGFNLKMLIFNKKQSIQFSRISRPITQKKGLQDPELQKLKPRDILLRSAESENLQSIANPTKVFIALWPDLLLAFLLINVFVII